MTPFQSGLLTGAIIILSIGALVIAIGNWLSARELERIERWRRAGIEPSKLWPRSP